MHTYLSPRQLSNPAPFIETAMLERPDLVDRIAAGDVLTPMQPDGYVATSDLCETIAYSVASYVPEGQHREANARAVMTGMDGAFKIAAAARTLGVPRMVHAPLSPEDATDARHEIEDLVNIALAYVTSHSDIAADVIAASQKHLDPTMEFGTCTYLGLAVGLVLANNGEAQKAVEDARIQARLRQSITEMSGRTAIRAFGDDPFVG